VPPSKATPKLYEIESTVHRTRHGASSAIVARQRGDLLGPRRDSATVRAPRGGGGEPRACVGARPRTRQLAFNIANIHVAMRHYPDAVRYLDRTLALNPRWTGIYADRAMFMLSGSGDVKAARRSLQDEWRCLTPGRSLTGFGSGRSCSSDTRRGPAAGLRVRRDAGW
jgi:hypothetical protein